MRTLVCAVLLVLWIPVVQAQQDPLVSYQPETPRVGEQVTITFHPTASMLQDSDEVDLVEWRLGQDFDVFPMQRVGDTWQATVSVYATSLNVHFYFRSGDLREDNDGRLWSFIGHDEDGIPLRGAYYFRSFSYNYLLSDADAIAEKQRADYRLEVTHHPDHLIARARLWKDALRTGADEAAVMDTVRQMTQAYWQAHAGTYDALSLIQFVYRDLGFAEQGTAFAEEAVQAHSESEAAQRYTLNRILSEEIIPLRVKELVGYFERYTEPCEHPSYTYKRLFDTYLQARQTERALTMAQAYLDREIVFRSRAHREVAEGLLEAGVAPDVILPFALQARAHEPQEPVGMVRFTTDTTWVPTAADPEKQVQAQRNLRLHNDLVIGYVYLAQGRAAEAVLAIEPALALFPDEPAVKHKLAEAYVLAGQAKQAYDLYYALAEDYPEDPAILNGLKGAYMTQHGTDDGFDAILASLQTHWANLPRPVYSVEEYNPARDPFEDLVATIAQAQAANKRILLQLGGEWCGWCHVLDRYVRQNEHVATVLRDHFIIMKVNWDLDNQNEAFLSQYPPVQAYPHIFVLEKDGTFLHTQDTGILESGHSYSEEALLTFLRAWIPTEPE